MSNFVSDYDGLIEKRDGLILQGVNPDELLVPLAALDGGPGTTEDAGEIFPEKPRVIRWHWKHQFPVWNEVFSGNSAGLMGAFTGGKGGPYWQSRACIVCNITQYRRVELREDR